jgi:hypothetical protein
MLPFERPNAVLALRTRIVDEALVSSISVATPSLGRRVRKNEVRREHSDSYMSEGKRKKSI